MNENTSQKIEPVIVARPGSGDSIAVDPALAGRPGAEQLARIEEKAARIEDKFARSEALLLRVQATFEDAMTEFGDLARRGDVAAVEQRIRQVPGFGGLFVLAILAAVLGAGLTIAALKFGVPWPVLQPR
ncbi:MAG: hypothetical protein JO366_14220 [Methylobacteriaceae bacterium]|nr:hypothetical protein [Methylobacteriaceae bacterium]MBV9222353.1 hypothetical protein [Methylobacteriaceae bacterium]MBV9245960.1 hypothetical protein [Methylobacteriaceae bacterium]MBV9636898.1 hypothetical protein [Methylobacteriaceae bacterium]MBV9705332.1 hypothetical protein [Methylobacteriaceae bacterium]